MKPQRSDVCSYIVVRTQIYLEAEQSERLAARAGAAGVTRSELIRRAIDTYLSSTEEDRDARLSRFRRAVRESAGIAPGLPPGTEYVREIRSAGARKLKELDRRHGR